MSARRCDVRTLQKGLRADRSWPARLSKMERAHYRLLTTFGARNAKS